jgi:serine protease AprX
VKAATHDGSTNLGELLLGMSWVVANRHRYGLDIRVLNLSFGSPLDVSYIADPLAYAAEQAWKAGIVVVAAAGNNNDVLGLNTPAADPFVIAVGATAMGKTPAIADDSVASWSRVGDWKRSPDLVAPGTSIVSLRDPGSFIDQNNPSGLVGTDYFKGSGTSQATAVISGAAALLLEDNPNLTPDQVKALLERSANPVPGASNRSEGSGQVDLADAAQLPVPGAVQNFPAASISAILGADHGRGVRVDPGGTGNNLAANRWSANRWSSNRWSSNRWSSNRWSGGSWGDDSTD